jgi:hypothetical protein
VKPIQHETKKVEMQETMVEIPKPQEEQAVVEDIDWEQFSPHHQEEV